ncbi:MAG: PA2779 family protein [Pseudomonadales bacterium]|nr:PA2779 family protein [Pseudomonadales bacterium]
MGTFTTTQKHLARILAALMLFVGVQSATVQAAMISTSDVIAKQTEQMNRAQVLELLNKQEAVDALTAMGIDPNTVEQRVNSMTAEELQAFNQQVADMQAGGDSLLGVVVLVFVVLIVLDLLGTTNIFPAIKPINTGQ